MAAKKGTIKATRPKKLTRAPKPTKVGSVDRIKPYALATGTPNEMNDQIQAGKLRDGKWVELEPKLPDGKAADRFMSEAAAKAAAVKFLEDKIPWCKRFNMAGIKRIEDAVQEVRDMAVQLWCCDPEAAEENARNRK